MSFQDLEAGGFIPRKGELLDSKQDPSQALAAGIFQINTAVSSFKRLVNSLGTPKDTPELREKIHKTRQHIGRLTKETATKLKSASEIDHRAPVISASKKVGDAKLAKDFEAVLREFQKTQRIAAEREIAYAPFIPQLVIASPRITANELKPSLEDRNENLTSLLVEQHRQEVFQLENEVTFNEALIEEREQGIKEIQEQIGEVNEIFKDLAVLVHEQGVMIDDIDSNVEGAHSATVQATHQLVKASKTQKSSSSLSCLLIVIFAVALVIVIIVLAV
ncbi:hypothetical protein O6H91_11G032100 [Diphasiastrum complanatum]|uniref:Uncharacterized protein n=1 Tax=Diphasiastrum complanatum TaxID=34168 RepID=A0ACC2C7K9_DIPCM|nr:hypothetical protein O6H91_11G032100 [Diphasiastrum complanatum]